MDSNERYERGLSVRRSVLGSEYVDSALAPQDEQSKALQQVVTELGWGFIWSREQLPRKTRSLMTLALLTALNRPRELAVHARGAVNNGCSKEEISEAILHCIPYAGIPAALDAMHVVNEVVDQH
ncbi:carboxymuconolactone decarboxylase family protein [Spiractinospora alimapuensis]|uniref:carboxymuconolactone decarboxylase family protein n=1 Tax=Spiractinospora alimapuensis TaxID=2820884 RepID=UPI001F2B3393|nr:carboxymuconolactone decarboxylase family protein [Spiractinospora alimapuensis]QVQ52277.1 carboxymuconolactone decarboxylase family protein [Spiractinospora alimapuensis]